METFFIQLAIILLTAFIVSYIIKALRQPIIIGYIIAGIIISPFILEAASNEVISIFSDLGIAFLLFIVGLHLNPKVIKEIGGASLFVGLAQMAFTFGVGYLASVYILGYNTVTSAYVGIALAFSSTIIIMKVLSDRHQLDSLYGKISIGILIIQDLVAVGVLMFISSMSSGENLSSFAIQGLIGGISLIFILFILGFLLIPGIAKNIARSQELLFLFSICWCFLVAALFSYFGFSIEIGALVAGVILSVSPYSTEISSRVRPLRDFFLIIFFIILGLKINLYEIQQVALNALILSAIVLIIKPLIIMVFMAIFGYTKRTNFLAGITLAQISEFSLIVLALGGTMGHISSEVISTITLTGIITITLSTYLMMYSNFFLQKLYTVISIFERNGVKEKRRIKKKYNAVLFGYNRIGFSILRSLKKIKKNYLVVDYNPDTINNLTKWRIPCLYGDVDDTELLKELPLEKIELAVSTMPDLETNILLLENVRNVNKDAIIILRAHQISDALELYERGANYVLTPHFLGGEYLAKMIKDIKIDDKKYTKEKQDHIKMLKKRLEHDHEHPEIEKN